MTMPDLPFEIVVPADGSPYCVTTTWDGVRIAWFTCATCHQSIVNCTHDVPAESAWLQRQHSPETARLFTLDHPGDGRSGVGRSERSLTAPLSVLSPRPAASLNVMDLVDQNLVDKIKTASEERDVPDRD